MSAKSASVLSQVPKIPPLLYGTAWKGEATSALVLEALAAGFRGVDVAGQRKHYREDLVGAAILQADADLGISRDKIWVQTKFTPISGQDLTGPVPYDPNAKPKDAVRQSFEASLRNIHQGSQWYWPDDATRTQEQPSNEGSSRIASKQSNKKTPWIDSFLLHSPLNSLEETLEAWYAMEELAIEGKVRLIGFSSEFLILHERDETHYLLVDIYDARILAALRRSAKRVAPRIVQNRWHHTSGHDVSLLSSFSPVLSPNDFAVEAKVTDSPDTKASQSICYQPFWVLTGNPRLLSSEAVLKAASTHKWTAAQVVYRFVAQGFGIPGVQCTVLSGTTDEAHMREAVHAVIGDEQLEDSEMDAIRKVIYGE